MSRKVSIEYLPQKNVNRRSSIEEPETESERLRVEARKKLDERIKYEEKMREQDIKRQEIVNKEVQALRIKQSAPGETVVEEPIIEDFAKKGNQSYSFTPAAAPFDQIPEVIEESISHTIPTSIYENTSDLQGIS